MSGSCGGLTAMSVGINGTQYTSRLTLTATTELNGRMINCTNGGLELIGSDIIRVEVLPPPPGPLTVTFSPESSLTISWSPPSGPVEGGVGGYVFGVTGEGCGCVSLYIGGDTTNVTCSGWTADGQTCSFEVRTLSLDSWLTSEPVTKSVLLSTPSAPTSLLVKPVYRIDGSAQYINVEFTGVDAPLIGANISGDVDYAVMFGSLTITEVTCNATNHCTARVTGSRLNSNGSLTVSVVASNAVGSGPPATFPTQVPTNTVDQEIITVQIHVANSTVTCHLLASFPETSNLVCLIMYGPSPVNCGLYMDSSTPRTGRPGDVVQLTLENISTGTDYCYTVSVNYGTTSLVVSGVFRSLCNPSALGGSPTSTDGLGTATISNGVVTYDGVTFGSTATLTCNSGYEPAGGTRTCMSDGNWSGEIQSCVAVPVPLWILAPIIIAVVTACGAVATIVVVFCYRKHKTKVPKDLHQSGPVYEDPDDVKPDPHTEGNLAYGHVQHTGRQQSSQPPTELRGQMYEEQESFKPDPHTQGNVAYGQVQF